MEKKRTITVGTIGHVDHGKTTLSAALTMAVFLAYGLSKSMSYNDIKRSPEEKLRGVTINQSTIFYETPNTLFIHVDCPGHQDYVKNMITGASSLDVPILTISAVDGVQAQTKAHAQLVANLLSSKRPEDRIVIVAINQIDRIDQDMIELVQSEVEDFLAQFVANGSFTSYKIFPVSALKAVEGDKEALARVLDIVNYLDELPSPQRDIDKPFYLCIESRYSIVGRGAVLAGAVSSGRCKVGDTVSILTCKGNTMTTSITSIEMFHKPIAEAVAGDNIGMLCRFVDGMNDVNKGDIVCAPKSRTMTRSFLAECYLYASDEGGRQNPIKSGFQPSVFVGTQAHTGTLFFTGNLNDAQLAEAKKLAKEHDTEKLMKLCSGVVADPGSQQSVLVVFGDKLRVPISNGDHCAVQEGNKNVAYLNITEIVEVA